jgi:CRP/FNR family cyclic AMP-dependent transcriptional regulator
MVKNAAGPILSSPKMSRLSRDKKVSTSFLLGFPSFFEQFSIKSYKKRHTIFQAGEESQFVYYVKKGYVRAYSLSPDGEELTMIIFQPGDFFPLISAVKVDKLWYFIESLTDVEIIPVPKKDFLDFLRGREDLLIDMTLMLTARFEGVLTRMEYLVFGTASQKLASIILILAERFGEKSDSEIFVKAPLTHKDLASLIGITRETTTLILRDFHSADLIAFKNKHLIIKNFKGLKRASLVETA